MVVQMFSTAFVAHTLCCTPESKRLLSRVIVDACSSLPTNEDGAPSPEVAAQSAAAAIAAIPQMDSTTVTDMMRSSMPPQGEFRSGVPFGQRYAAAYVARQDGAALQTLGLLTYQGVGGATQDDRASALWHAAAARQGNLDGLAVLGGCVRNGVGAEWDEATGLALIRAAAAVGTPSGLNKLGVLHEGTLPSGDVDEELAARLFERSAAAGSALGLFYHGWALIHGVGVAMDVEGGLAAYRASAKLAPDDGAEEAAFQLWEAHATMEARRTKRRRGEIPPDRWLRLAAAMEHTAATEALARWEANEAGCM